jgi:hypothetical protein
MLKMDLVEVLNFLFQLGSLELGQVGYAAVVVVSPPMVI